VVRKAVAEEGRTEGAGTGRAQVALQVTACTGICSRTSQRPLIQKHTTEADALNLSCYIEARWRLSRVAGSAEQDHLEYIV